MAYNQNAGYGRALLDLVGGIVPAFGDIHVVVSSSDYADPNYTKLYEVFKADASSNITVHLWTSLADAYTAVTSNNNDVIVLDAHSTHSLSAQLNWTKNRVHVIGFDGSRPGAARFVQQGAKVELTGSAANSAVVLMTGSRNSFHNIKFIQSSTNAASLAVFADAGEGNLYTDCSFIFGVADNLDQSDATEFLVSSDSATFISCSFGTDVLTTSAARTVVQMTNASNLGLPANDGAKSNRFKDCEFVIMSSDANAKLIGVASTSSAKFLNKWVDCDFVAVKNNSNGAGAITNAIASVAGFVEGSLIFVRPTVANCTNGCAGVTDNVVVTAPAASSNAWEGVTPA